MAESEGANTKASRLSSAARGLRFGHKKPRTRRGAVLICHVRQFGAVVLLMPKNLRRA